MFVMRSCPVWDRFYQNFKQDLKLWLYLLLIQQLWRIAFIANLNKYLSAKPSAGEMFLTMLTGARFDSVWATIAIFVTLFLVTVPAIFSRKLAVSKYPSCFRWWWAATCSLLVTIIYVVSIEYYLEYHDIFNQFLFGLVYDDRKAILQTILAQDYLFKYALIISLLFLGSIYWCKKLFNTKLYVTSKPFWFKWLLSVLVLVFYVGSFRGGYGARPIQLKDAALLQDEFLCKAVISPFSALRYAVKQRKLILQQDYGRQFLVNRNIVELLASKYGSSKTNADFDNYMLRQATGLAANKKIPQAKHVFVVIGESYDAWALQDAYQDLKLTTELQKIAAKGIQVKNFLPAADGTIAALTTIISGLLETEVMINYQPSSTYTYPTAPAAAFKSLGYQTNFFYGGYLGWQKIGDLATNQGFDNVYGGAHMSDWLHGSEWGVDDHVLYDFIVKTLQEDTPSYNVIMTTSNHPPFRVNLTKAGCDLAHIKKQLLKYPNSPATAEQLGHLWYADHTLGKFVKNIEAKLSLTLFAITGDHYGRRHIIPNPPPLEAVTVPLVLYGAGITDKLSFAEKVAGCHVDIGPTLIELVAPSGFEYYALGNNLFDAANAKLAINKNYVLSQEFGLLSSQNLHEMPKELMDKYIANMGLSWWRVVKGNSLISDDKNKST